MSTVFFEKMVGEKKNFVFIGEAGSGKSELAINFALKMAQVSKRKVHFFDMDQTKPLFRSRDVAEALEAEGIVVHSQAQFLDAPTVVPGVIESLMDENACVLMDIGGNATGARMVGQFSHLLNDENTRVFFIINTYRPWSRDVIGIEETIEIITRVSRIKKVDIVSNPNLGQITTPADVVEGNNKLLAMLGERRTVDYVCVLSNLVEEVAHLVKEPIIPVDIFILYPWLQKDPPPMIPNGPRGLYM